MARLVVLVVVIVVVAVVVAVAVVGRAVAEVVAMNSSSVGNGGWVVSLLQTASLEKLAASVA
eukprot:975858-Prorocentrum_lima.AAC.1